MFEKEAEEYANRKCGTIQDNEWKFCNLDWQEGAEFGYNKANEWQEGLPTKDIRLAIIEVEDCGYLLCEYRKGVWYDNGSSAVCKDWITRNIKRWKEIVLPKESK